MIRWRFWTSVCKMKAPNWSERELLIYKRYSVLWVWSQRKAHCSDKPRTVSIQRCPPSPRPSRPPAFTTPKDDKIFSDDLMKRHSVFLDPQKTKNCSSDDLRKRHPVFLDPQKQNSHVFFDDLRKDHSRVVSPEKNNQIVFTKLFGRSPPCTCKYHTSNDMFPRCKTCTKWLQVKVIMN